MSISNSWGWSSNPENSTFVSRKSPMGEASGPSSGASFLTATQMQGAVRPGKFLEHQVTNMLPSASRRSGDVASYLMLQHFPLSSAYLCQDCNSIGNNANQCPACASEVLMNLSTVLNRDENMISSQYSSLPTLAAATAHAGSALAA